MLPVACRGREHREPHGTSTEALKLLIKFQIWNYRRAGTASQCHEPCLANSWHNDFHPLQLVEWHNTSSVWLEL